MKGHKLTVINCVLIVQMLACSILSAASLGGWAGCFVAAAWGSVAVFLLTELQDSINLDAAMRARRYYEQTGTDEARENWHAAVDRARRGK